MTDNANNAETINNSDNVKYFELISAMRSPDVTANNSATLWARETLRRMLAVNEAGKHEFSIDNAIAMVCEVYKPMTAKGKRSNTVGALRESGWHGMAKRLTDLQYIDRNIGKGDVEALVKAFIASDKPKDSFQALNLAVKAAIKAAAEKDAPKDETPAEQEQEQEQEQPKGESQPAQQVSVAQSIAMMQAAIESLSDANLAEEGAMAALQRLAEAVAAAYAKAEAAAIADGEALADAVAQLQDKFANAA